MSYCLNSLKGVIQGIIWGTTKGGTKGDTRSLDNGLYDAKPVLGCRVECLEVPSSEQIPTSKGFRIQGLMFRV